MDANRKRPLDDNTGIGGAGTGAGAGIGTTTPDAPEDGSSRLKKPKLLHTCTPELTTTTTTTTNPNHNNCSSSSSNAVEINKVNSVDQDSATTCSGNTISSQTTDSTNDEDKIIICQPSKSSVLNINDNNNNNDNDNKPKPQSVSAGEAAARGVVVTSPSSGGGTATESSNEITSDSGTSSAASLQPQEQQQAPIVSSPTNHVSNGPTSSGTAAATSLAAPVTPSKTAAATTPTQTTKDETTALTTSNPIAPPTTPITTSTTSTTTAPTLEKKPTPPPPLKSTAMSHLHKKYMPQLEFMDREFKRLERQLHGARPKNGKEAAGSRERREKLHTFILHLEDTMQQVELGCKLENEGKSTLGVAFSSMGGGDANATTTTPINGGSDTNSGNNHNNNQNGTLDKNQSSQTQQGIRNQLNEEEEEAKEEFARTSALTNLTKEKEEEENVQRLEEHILANLLPVKDRLIKQLENQKGLSRNPAGIPIPRNNGIAQSTDKGKLTFGKALENRRLGPMHLQQQQDSYHNSDGTGPVGAPATKSQFGKPLGGGSSLTQKLHGNTLGSHQRAFGHGVGYGNDKTIIKPSQDNRKVLYAGMTPGSTQVSSGQAAAESVHTYQKLVIEETQKAAPILQTSGVPPVPVPPPPPAVMKPSCEQAMITATIQKDIKVNKPHQFIKQIQQPLSSKRSKVAVPIPTPTPVTSSRLLKASVPPPPPGYAMTVIPKPKKKSLNDPGLTEEQRQEMRERKMLKKRRRAEARHRQQIYIQQQQQQIQHQHQQQQPQKPSNTRRTSITRPVAPRKGPRSVEYMCGLCNESYKSTCDYNPWWALTSHECLKCGKVQIPRLDISAPENAIEYHPALLAHAADDAASKASKNSNNNAVGRIKGYMSVNNPYKDCSLNLSMLDDSDSDSDLDTSDSDTSFDDDMSPSSQAENEDFGANYSGPKFNEYDASRLLTMMEHASTCPGRHKTSKANNICMGIKYLMLHVRDCPGTTSTFDICPYPWCRKTKHLLYHLVSCLNPDKCKICSSEYLTLQMKQLRGLNTFRREKQTERMKCVPCTNVETVQAVIKLPSKVVNTNNQANQRGIKNVPLNKVKIHQRQSPISIPTVSQPRKQTLSVPSPIPSVGNARQDINATNVGKLKHPGAPIIVAKPTANRQTAVRSNPANMDVSAPANPLLLTPKMITLKTQIAAKSNQLQRPLQTANPLQKQPSLHTTSHGSKVVSRYERCQATSTGAQVRKVPTPLSAPRDIGPIVASPKEVVPKAIVIAPVGDRKKSPSKEVRMSTKVQPGILIKKEEDEESDLIVMNDDSSEQINNSKKTMEKKEASETALQVGC